MSRELPSANIFQTEGYQVIQMRASALFLAKTNIKFFKKFIVCPHLTWTGGRRGERIEPVLTFFWTRGGQFFMILKFESKRNLFPNNKVLF